MPHAYASSERLTDSALRAYVVEYDKKLRTIPYSGLYRYAVLAHYHATYLNPTHYATCPKPELSNMTPEANRPLHRGEKLINEILVFLLTTEVATLTGISFKDMLEMDLSLFYSIRDKYDEIEAPKRKALAKIQDEMNKQNNDIKNKMK